jgi:hypothetical protein
MLKLITRLTGHCGVKVIPEKIDIKDFSNNKIGF